MTPLNPNHKVRLVLLPAMRWIADIKFAAKDDSLYLIPHVEQIYEITGKDADGTDFQESLAPGIPLHVSYHATGTLNLTLGPKRITVRNNVAGDFFGKIFDLGIRQCTLLRQAYDAEIKSLPARYRVVSVVGILQSGPIFLSVFRLRLDEQWHIPVLSTMLQVNYECPIRNRNVKYGFVVWQSNNVVPFAAEIAFSV